MPLETRTTSTSHSGDTGDAVNAGNAVDAGDAGDAVDKAESPPRDPKPPKICNVDPEGDLFLEVKTLKDAPYRFRVCSRTLRRHSPVWKTMLFGPWSESKPTNSEEWIIQLPEDPPYMMRTILNIVHGRFDQVPKRFMSLPPFLRLTSLRGVLSLTNKYDMTSIVRPWCDPWIEIARESMDTLNSLYVAWELGDEELFTSRLEDVSMRTSMDAEGLSCYNKNVTLNDIDHLGPQDALETICAIRETLLERLITPVHEELDARMKAEPYCKFLYLDTGYQKILCDAATIGSIHRHMLQTRGSILTKSVSEIEDSVVGLGDWLSLMMFKVPTVHQSAPFGERALDEPLWRCFVAEKYRKLYKRIEKDLPTIVAGFITPSHKEYMAAQRAKNGLVMQGGIPTSKRPYWHSGTVTPSDVARRSSTTVRRRSCLSSTSTLSSSSSST